MKNKSQNEPDPFFAEPVDPRVEARTQASEAICCLLIWMADAPTLEDRGLRATVALYCIRPDLTCLGARLLSLVPDFHPYFSQTKVSLAGEDPDSAGE